jgi:arylsulfatase A-like enzyme
VRGSLGTPVLLLLCLGGISCQPEPFEGPLHLLERPTVAGRLARTGAVTTGDETRPALLESARYSVRLPRRALLTFGLGVSSADGAEVPGWFRLSVRADGKVLLKRRLNPRAVRGWRDVNLELEGHGGATELGIEIQLTDLDQRPVEWPPSLLLAVADPTVHDLDNYGRARGVLLISVDTLRRDHVGAYGYPKPTTPRFDALGHRGILCEDAVSTSSWTLPAHLSLLTSVSPVVHGGVDAAHGFNHQVPTLASTLRKAGFATRAVTSHLYVSGVYGLDEGFDHLDFHQDRKATDVANRAMDLLDRFGDRPFFIFLHFYDPHWHYDPPEHTRRLFEGSYAGTLTGLWQDFSRKRPEDLGPGDLDHLLALYDGEIRYVDDEVGRIFDHMKLRGLDRGTLVVFTSDHGEEFLDHGSWEHQKTLYEEVIRVPLMVAGPGISPRREPAQASLLDVVPTILDWAGVAAEAPLEGLSLLSPLPGRELYGETEHTVDETRKLFWRQGSGGWKAIFSLARDTNRLVTEEWFHLATDPSERQNSRPSGPLAGQAAARTIERWHRLREGRRQAPTVDLTPEQRERLRALGYLAP